MTAGNKTGHGADTSDELRSAIAGKAPCEVHQAAAWRLRDHHAGRRALRSPRHLPPDHSDQLASLPADRGLRAPRDQHRLRAAVHGRGRMRLRICAPGSFADAFFFSVETSATVGYGEMHPVTFYGHAVCTAEIFVGIAFTALATGLLFVRFSRPKARIRFAENAVVASHAGQPTLMIRLANGRRGLLYDAAAHLALLLSVRGERRRSGPPVARTAIGAIATADFYRDLDADAPDRR